MDLSQLGTVRRLIAAYASRCGRSEAIEPTSMCVTEMLSNVAKHAGSAKCTLTIESTDAGLRAVVSDRSHCLPVVREPRWSDESGRGMYLLSRTADAWGTVLTRTGKEVWVEVHVS